MLTAQERWNARQANLPEGIRNRIADSLWSRLMADWCEEDFEDFAAFVSCLEELAKRKNEAKKMEMRR
jgi:hypothetical protein